MSPSGRHAAVSRTGALAAALLLLLAGVAAAACTAVLEGGAQVVAGALGCWGVVVGALALRHGLRPPASS